jgi:hypothetical protein
VPTADGKPTPASLDQLHRIERVDVLGGDRSDESTSFRADASFRIRPPLAR